jgi:hypothetical protein
VEIARAREPWRRGQDPIEVTVKSLDLLLAAYSLTNGVPILTLDGDFRLIARAGVGLQLVDF